MTTSTIILLSIVFILVLNKIKNSALLSRTTQLGLKTIDKSERVISNGLDTIEVASDVVLGASIMAHGLVRKGQSELGLELSYKSFSDEINNKGSISITEEKLNAILDAKIAEMTQQQTKPTRRTRKSS